MRPIDKFPVFELRYFLGLYITSLIIGFGCFAFGLEISAFDSAAGNITFTESSNFSKNLTINKDANTATSIFNLTGYPRDYNLMVDDTDSYFVENLRNVSSEIFTSTIIGQNISAINKTIDKITWRWGCQVNYGCTGNISYKVRFAANKSILSECNASTANVSTGFNYYVCDFTNFNVGDSNLIFTIELENSPADSPYNIRVLGETNKIHQNFWGSKWSYYNSRIVPEWEEFPPSNTSPYFSINITFVDGTSYDYPDNLSIFINNTRIWNYTGEFNTTSQTNSFASVLNSALNSGKCDCSGCYLSGNNCTMALTFHSDTAGILQYSAINITWNESIKPNLTIPQPTGEKSSTQVTYNLSAADNHELNLCKYWVTRGASLEVANTTITCSDTISDYFYVSSLATNYTFHAYVRDASGNANYSNSSFSTASDAVVVVPGGGGSSNEPETEEKRPAVCDTFPLEFKEALNNFLANQTWVNFLTVWQAFWNRGLCDSAGSIVPRSYFYSK